MATRTGVASSPFSTATTTAVDFGAPFSPAAITGIAAGAAAGLGLLAIGLAFLLALVIKTRAPAPAADKRNSLAQLEAELRPEVVSAYEPMTVRNPLGGTPRGSTNTREDLDPGRRGMNISSPLNLELANFTPMMDGPLDRDWNGVNNLEREREQIQAQPQQSYFPDPLRRPVGAPYERTPY